MSETFDINKKNLNKGIFSILYTKWSHYDVLYPLEKKEIISFNKSKISKVKKVIQYFQRFLLKIIKK